jgi:diguanylate cyclase (GGDEF)-like protein
MNAAAAKIFPPAEEPQFAVESIADSDVEVNLAPAEVLIVEDDTVLLERLSLMAEGAGYHVYAARDGREAWQILQQNFCALVLTDIVMPTMSGTELCSRMRVTRFPSYIYTIALSAHDGSDEVVAALSAGADDFLSKRATKSELLARLRAGRRIVGLEQALRQSLQSHARLAHVDALTGCFTRFHLVAALERELARSRQYGHWVSVLMCDVDRFHAINDQYGLEVGNEVLQRTGQRIRDLVEGESAAWVARYGVDRFTVVLPEAPPEHACTVAEHLRQSLAAAPLVCAAGLHQVAISVGVCAAGPSELYRDVSASSLLDAAFDCMKDAKNAGGNAVMAKTLRPHGKRVAVAPETGA